MYAQEMIGEYGGYTHLWEWTWTQETKTPDYSIPLTHYGLFTTTNRSIPFHLMNWYNQTKIAHIQQRKFKVPAALCVVHYKSLLRNTQQ